MSRVCGWRLIPVNRSVAGRKIRAKQESELVVVRIRIAQRGLDAEEIHMHAFLSVEAAARWMSRFLARRLPEAFEKAMGVRVEEEK